MDEEQQQYQRRRGMDAALDHATSLQDMTREQSIVFRDQLAVQEKLCESRHRLALKDLPSTLRWVVAFATCFWLVTGVVLGVWVFRLGQRLDNRVDAMRDMVQAIGIANARGDDDEQRSREEVDLQREGSSDLGRGGEEGSDDE